MSEVTRKGAQEQTLRVTVTPPLHAQDQTCSLLKGAIVQAGTMERLAGIMRRMAAGDAAAAFTLYEEFGPALAAALSREARRQGAALSRADLDGVVIEACLELLACAAGWDPDGGALPWTWASRRLRSMVARHVGIHGDSLDAESGRELPDGTGVPPAAGGTGPAGASALETLEHLAGTDETCRLLLDALEEACSPRDRALLLEMHLQAVLADPSPAVTVGREFGLRPATVRQAAKRSRDRVRALAAREPRYAPLAELRMLA